MITETELIQQVSLIAGEAFKSYLQDALVSPELYTRVVGSTLQRDALRAIQKNDDILLELANAGGIDYTVNQVLKDNGTQDFLFSEYLDNFNSAKKDYEKQIEYSLIERAEKIFHEKIEDSGISDILFVTVTGSTIEAVTQSIVEDLTIANPLDVEQADLLVAINNSIAPLKARIYEYAQSKVHDDLIDQYHLTDPVSLSKVNNYDEDNCRYASGSLSLKEYIEKNIPDSLDSSKK